MSTCRLFLLALFLSSLLCGATDGLVSVATWNLQNFLLQNRYEEGQFRLEYPLPESRKQHIRDLILQTRPDVLFLQEMGSEAFLRELQLDLAADGLRFTHVRFSGLPDASRGLAVLSQIPLNTVIFHDPVQFDDASSSVRRGIQEVGFTFGTLSVRFYHVHLKSRYSTDDSDPQSRRIREAEIRAVRTFLHANLPVSADDRIFLVGDFNTPFDSPLIDPLKQEWQPVKACDAAGMIWTYHHRRSGTKDRIDGFWQPLQASPFPLSAVIFPDTPAGPSDHRMVLLSIPSKNLVN